MAEIKNYLKKIETYFKPKVISIEDLKYLNELLKSNLPLKSCMALIQTDNNSKVFQEITKRLDKGELIEKIIKDYLNKDIGMYMSNLLKNLSFSNSLELALSFHDKNKENMKFLEKSIAYPIILLFISLSALFLFDNYGLDSILNLMKSFNTDITTYSILRAIMRFMVYAFYILFIIVSLIILIFIKPKRITMFYLLMNKYLPNNFLKIYYTEEFVSLLIITLKLGYKTKDALTILKSLINKPLVSFMAYHLDDYLLEGASLKEASKQKYYDETFSKFVNIASYTTNFVKILESYVELARNKIKNKMKLYTTILQLSSYVVIGFVIVFIYQILFLPMQAITSF